MARSSKSNLTISFVRTPSHRAHHQILAYLEKRVFVNLPEFGILEGGEIGVVLLNEFAESAMLELAHDIFRECISKYKNAVIRRWRDKGYLWCYRDDYSVEENFLKPAARALGRGVSRLELDDSDWYVNRRGRPTRGPGVGNWKQLLVNLANTLDDQLRRWVRHIEWKVMAIAVKYSLPYPRIVPIHTVSDEDFGIESSHLPISTFPHWHRASPESDNDLESTSPSSVETLPRDVVG